MASPSSRDAGRVVFFVFVTVFLDLVGFGIVAPLLPLYVKSMGGTAETVGFLFASFSCTQLIATPILGRLSDARGRRRVILTSLAGNAASMVLFAVATELRALPLLFASRILAGATAGNIAACQAAVADVTSGDARAKGMGRVGAGIGLGMVLGPVIGGWATKLGASAPPLAAASLALLDLVGAFFLMPETHVPGAATEGGPGDGAKRAHPWATVFEDAGILAVLALFFLTFLYMTNIQVALPLLASQRLGWSEADIGTVFAGFGVLMLVVQGVLIGRMTRAFGARNLVVAGELSAMAGLLVIAGAHATWSLSCGLAMLGLGLGVTNPLLSTLASERAGPSRQGAVLGVAQSAGGLARTVGPIGVGELYAHVGPSAPFTGGAFAACAAMGIALLLVRPRAAIA